MWMRAVLICYQHFYYLKVYFSNKVKKKVLILMKIIITQQLALVSVICRVAAGSPK